MSDQINKITNEKALQLSSTKFWEQMDYYDRAKFQLFTDLMCMPFDVFHEALEKCLGRPVYTHELSLNYDGICGEFLGEVIAPTLDEIVNLIPKSKLIIINGSEVSRNEGNRF